VINIVLEHNSDERVKHVHYTTVCNGKILCWNVWNT